MSIPSNNTIIPTQPSCVDIYESGLLPVEQALKKILSALPCLADYETINIEQTKGRTLSQAITAPFNVPLHNNSAVDGYALNSTDLPDEAVASLSITGTAFAGNPWSNTVNPGECIRIMTGAVIPLGTDTVIMQEHVKLSSNSITIDSTHQK